MTTTQPETTVDQRFSDPGGTATPWAEAVEELAAAEIYWLSTVRRDRRPHVTPLIAIWLDDALWFCTGEGEQKAKNLESNRECVITTGCNRYGEGLDVIVEGAAAAEHGDATLQRLADSYVAKYGSDWHFTVRDGALHQEEGAALVFRIAPRVAFGHHRGSRGSQTRWRFDAAPSIA